MSKQQADNPSSRIKPGRMLNIAFRTAHIAVTGVLLGGFMFSVALPQLTPWLYASIITGLILIAIEAYPRWWWFHQGQGVMSMAKVLLLCLMAFYEEYRMAMLFAVVILASVGSHMPARYRYYSFLHRRVLKGEEPES